jgi:hypothetical protein
MKILKTDVIEFDEEAYRKRILYEFAGPMQERFLAMLNAFVKGDWEVAAGVRDALPGHQQGYVPLVVRQVLDAHAVQQSRKQVVDEQLDSPGPFRTPDGVSFSRAGAVYPKQYVLTPQAEFVNPNDVRVQHGYALHVLYATRHALKKTTDLLRATGGSSPEVDERCDRSIALLKAAKGAEDTEDLELN